MNRKQAPFMHRRSILSILFSITLVAAALAATTYDLKRIVKVGDEVKTAFTIEIKAGEKAAKVAEGIEKGAVLFTVSAKSIDTVTAITAEGGYTYSSLTKELRIRTPDGQEFPQEDDADGTNISVNADRTVLKIETEELDAAQMRLSILSTLKAPEKGVEVGAKWTSKIPANGEGTFAAEGNYELVAIEKVGEFECLKIKISIRELDEDEGGKCEGFMWLDTKTFSDVKKDIKYTDVAFPQIPFPVDIDLKESRV